VRWLDDLIAGSNWSGIVLGMSLALALFGAGVAGFARRPRAAVSGLSATMMGVAGVLLALGNDYLAIAVAFVLGAAVPSLLLLALTVSPSSAEADFKPRNPVPVQVVIVVSWAVLTLGVMRARWAPQGGASQNTIEWIGSRFLTDHLLTLDLIAGLLAVAACGAIALLRGRGARRT
jgi:NADH:ubiquinone oxidoreductase subunit 6 (subunit J)